MPTVPVKKSKGRSSKPSGKGKQSSRPSSRAGGAKSLSAAVSSSAPEQSVRPTTSAPEQPASGRGRGRPTDYRPEFAERVFKLCLLGAKDKEIADILGVTESTLNLWKTQHLDFSESMRAGKDEADAAIAHSLYHRAKGYSHPAVKIMQDKGEVIVEPYTEHYPPDTAAASLWLRNRQPARWRDKIDHEMSGKTKVEHSGSVKLSPEEAYLRMIGASGKPG